jgi:hypothetical protein
MFTDNPFSGLANTVPTGVMQGFVLVMIVLVAGGTLYDMWHKGSARYFFANWRTARKRGTRHVGTGEALSLLVRAAVVEGLTSGEFCSLRRRLSHLLTMYGFLAYVVTTVILVFVHPAADKPAPAIVPALWHIGALMICLGGYWFWFFIRVDVVAEGHTPFRIVRADLFILSLLANATLALVWSWLQFNGSAWSAPALGLYLFSAIILFGSVPWSKFSHMFFKPAAAFQKRVQEANGSRSNLPLPADRPAVLGSARQHPRHF